MADWSTLEAEAAPIAQAGRRLIYRGGDGEALLATIRDAGTPQIHPINVGIVDGVLYAFIGPSGKRGDLEQDGRYALHTHLDPAAPDEFSLRGRASPVADVARRATVAAGWAFTVDDRYRLFALDIESAILGERGADEWPPRYRRWPPKD